MLTRLAHHARRNVVAYLALFVGFTGTAAASVIVTDNSQVAPNTIYGHVAPSGANQNIIAGSVGNTDLANAAVNASKIGVLPGAHLDAVAQSIPNAAVTPVHLPDVQFDTGNLHSSTDDTSLTVHRAGKYLISGELWYNNLSGGAVRDAELRKNGTIIAANQEPPVNGNATTLDVTDVVKLAAGDKIQLDAYQDSGTTATIPDSSTWPTYLSVEWIGA